MTGINTVYTDQGRQ